MRINEKRTMLTMRVPDNWHAHFRQGDLCRFLVRQFIEAGWRGRIVAEPNRVPPVLTGAEALVYREEIMGNAFLVENRGAFEPVMTMQITEDTLPEEIAIAIDMGIKVFKVYPRGVTNNSNNGVKDYHKIYPALAAVERRGGIVQFHGEDPSHEVEGLLKEDIFLERILDPIVHNFPDLKISLEHITTATAVEWVRRQHGGNVVASITAHHLFTTIDDVIGYSPRSEGLISPHLGCKPMPKFRRDLETLVEAATSGDECFIYGGDDAAHPRRKKECAHAACGVWNTPTALPILIDLFEKAGELETKLEPFLSQYGAEFYGYPLNTETVVFERSSWKVPEEYPVPAINDSIVPFAAGETLNWQIAN